MRKGDTKDFLGWYCVACGSSFISAGLDADEEVEE